MTTINGQLAAINVKKPARSANVHVKTPRSANVHAKEVVRSSEEERNPTPNPTPNPTMMKRCTICREMKPLSAFNLDSHRPDGHMLACRRCQQLRRRKASPLSKQLARFTTDDLEQEILRRRSLPEDEVV